MEPHVDEHLEGAAVPEPGPGYERSDANVRSIVLAGIALCAAIVATLVICVWVFDAFLSGAATRDVPISLVPGAEKREVPPPPRLQVQPQEDLGQIRADEDAALHGYGWVDRKAGVVRIPIERAMELLVERSAGERGGGR